jgi:hypothetical protein
LGLSEAHGRSPSESAAVLSKDRVLHDGDDAQPAATARTGEDIEGEHAAQAVTRS